MEFKISQYSIYSSGQRTDAQGRPLQEDYIYPALGHASADDRLFVVCDGMGGSGYGLYASSTVCRAFSRYLLSLPKGQCSPKDMEQAVDAAFDELDRADRGQQSKMGTTLAALALCQDGYVAAHIGDSRVYHIRPGRSSESTRILWRTDDHTLVNYLVRNGKMTPEEALTSPKRHVITRALQPHMEKRCRPDIHASDDVRAGDYFLLCSDGLLESLTDDNIRAIFSAEGGTIKNKVALLNKATNDNKDNISAIIVLVTEVIDVQKSDPHADKPNKRDKKKDNMDNKQSPKKGSQVSEGVREFVNRHKVDGDTGPLLFKFVFALMGVLALIMIIYYLFVRTDETLQTAGTATDPVNIEESETYGYEITAEDIRNEAQPIAPEIESQAPEEEEEEITAPEDFNVPEPQEPQSPSDEPILQE